MKSNQHKKLFRDVQHPLFGISFRNWIQLLDRNGGIDARYIDRAAFITLGSLFTAPSRFIFTHFYKHQIKDYVMEKPPVFIIGHWRSGTTFLHELLSSDPQFCYVSLWNTMLPDSFPLFDSTKQLLSHFLPRTRPMDNIEVEINGPYEEEAGIAVLSPWSFFHGLHFPRNAEEQYIKSIHFNGLSESEQARWKEMYENYIKTVVFSHNGKRLLLKDPANTARIPLLLELFPEAKFIHIYRNPYKVYASTIKMRNKVLTKLALQQGNEKIIQQQVINNYKRLMKAYFKQKKLIPTNNLIEIRYEYLVKQPIEKVKQIYTQLNLPGLKNALPEMNQYLQRKKNYKTNVYQFDEDLVRLVNEQWDFTIKKWGYSPPQ